MIKNTLNKSISCICKSVDLRHTFLYIESFDDENATVKPIIGEYERPLMVPRRLLYRSDEKLFNRLRSAYECGDRKKLKALWDEAVIWESE